MHKDSPVGRGAWHLLSMLLAPMGRGLGAAKVYRTAPHNHVTGFWVQVLYWEKLAPVKGIGGGEL